mmetsp:Transcript_465/g.1335  ORF Transcript_465/g.1335 Transcript_465/m.1335 type:complete len:284 (-) Transcript_465:1460-2311(-)
MFFLRSVENYQQSKTLNGTTQTTFQRHQFLSASHHVLQLIRRDLTTLRCAQCLTAVKNCETISHRKRMADVVGDKHHGHALLSHFVDGRQNIRRLSHAKRGCRLVQNEYFGPEVYRTCDGDCLPLTTRQGAHCLIWAAKIDAHLAHLVHRDLIGVVMIKEIHRTDLFHRLIAHEKVPAHRHQWDHGQVLVHCRNTGRNRITRVRKMHLLTFKQNLALGRLMHTGHGFDESRFSSAIVAKQTVAFARKYINRNTGQRDDATKVLFDVFHLNERGMFRIHINAPP